MHCIHVESIENATGERLLFPRIFSTRHIFPAVVSVSATLREQFRSAENKLSCKS